MIGLQECLASIAYPRVVVQDGSALAVVATLHTARTYPSRLLNVEIFQLAEAFDEYP